MTQPAHQYEDPAAEGSTRAVHLAAMLLSIAEGVARLRAERLAAQTTRDERDAAAARAQQRADRAATWLEGRNHGRPTPTRRPRANRRRTIRRRANRRRANR